MKKNTDLLQSVIDAIANSKKAVAEANSRIAVKQQRLDELLLGADVENDAVITEIGKLQTYVSIFPRQMELLENAVITAETTGAESVDKFLKETMYPRIRTLKERAGSKVESDLRPHFGQNKDVLAAKVAESQLIRGIESNSPSYGGAAHHGASFFATNVLTAWKKLDEIETQLPPVTA